MTVSYQKIKTLGDLKKSGWESVSVKEEMRRNLITKMQNGETLFPGILGYDKTVIPQLQHAILAKHDTLLLGLRGQAKSRILRMLINFLDEYMPIVAGSEINDDPFHPISKYARELLEKKGDDTPIEWVHRSNRYAEKLATPDTTVADLIGDIDPIKAATRKITLADEEVINFGIIPRTNRGIFAINELPDLQPRIQVALLNIMQERDIQIRGFNIRIPLDISIFFSANPEDYTNRGNIITPLKDRIDAQIITHYPRTIDIGMQITEQEAWISRESDVKVIIPHFIREIIEEMAFNARESEYVDQKSGVSARLTITAMELLVSSAERRALMNNEKKTYVRIADLYHSLPALTGKLELVYEGEQEGAINVAKHMIGKAINKVYVRYFPNPQLRDDEGNNDYSDIVEWFSRGNKVELPDNITLKEYQKALKSVNGLEDFVKEHSTKIEDKEELLVLMDFALEALHQNSVLGKDDLDDQRSFTDMVGSMLGDLGDIDNDFGDFE